MLAVAGRYGRRSCGVAVVAAHEWKKRCPPGLCPAHPNQIQARRVVPILRRCATSWLRARPNRPASRFPHDDFQSASSSYIVAAVRLEFTPVSGHPSADWSSSSPRTIREPRLIRHSTRKETDISPASLKMYYPERNTASVSTVARNFPIPPHVSSPTDHTARRS